jgi:hypothetical protein
MSIGLLLIATWQNMNMRVIYISYVRIWLQWIDPYVYTNTLQRHVTSNNNILHNPVYLHTGTYTQMTLRHYYFAKISVEWQNIY